MRCAARRSPHTYCAATRSSCSASESYVHVEQTHTHVSGRCWWGVGRTNARTRQVRSGSIQYLHVEEVLDGELREAKGVDNRLIGVRGQVLLAQGGERQVLQVVLRT